jgi:Ca2+-binding EF-hand superfamily protein
MGALAREHRRNAVASVFRPKQFASQQEKIVSYRSLIVLAGGATAFGTAAIAQAPAAAPANKPIPRAEVVRQINANFKQVDTNGDGGVTAAEISAAQDRGVKAAEAEFVKRRAEAFRRFDTNKDGQLSTAEFNAGSPLPQAKRADPAQALSQMDANKDKKLNVTEFGAQTLANFDRADTNRDGTVSVEEQKAAIAKR